MGTSSMLARARSHTLFFVFYYTRWRAPRVSQVHHAINCACQLAMFTVHDSPQVQIAHKNIKIGHTLFTQGTWKIPLLNNYNTGPDFIIQPKLKAFVTTIRNTLNSGYSCRMSFESIIFESAIVVEQSSQIDISVSPKIDANTSLVTMVCFLHHTACVFLRPSLVTHKISEYVKSVCWERNEDGTKELVAVSSVDIHVWQTHTYTHTCKMKGRRG